MNVPVSWNLTRHRSQTDQVRSCDHDTLAGHHPFKHLHHAALSNAELNGPPDEGLSGELHKYNRPAGVINDGRVRNDRRQSALVRKKPNMNGLIYRNSTVAVIYFVDYGECSRSRIDNTADRNQPLKASWFVASGDLHFGPGELPDPGEFCFGDDCRDVDCIDIDNL
jgi:hypothetical protein